MLQMNDAAVVKASNSDAKETKKEIFFTELRKINV